MGIYKNHTSPRHAVKLQRQEQALKLRRAGLSIRQVAAEIGIGKSAAQALIASALEHSREQIDSAASDLRAVEVARLDGMLRKVQEMAEGGDLQAVDRALKIGERRAKLLGLEAPVRIETTGRDGAPIEVSSTLSIDPSKLSSQTLRELLDARTQPDRG